MSSLPDTDCNILTSHEHILFIFSFGGVALFERFTIIARDRRLLTYDGMFFEIPVITIKAGIIYWSISVCINLKFNS